MRHFLRRPLLTQRLPLPPQVPRLPPRVVHPTTTSPLVLLPSSPHRLPPGCSRAILPAVPLSPVAVRADRDQDPTSRALEKPVVLPLHSSQQLPQGWTKAASAPILSSDAVACRVRRRPRVPAVTDDLGLRPLQAANQNQCAKPRPASQSARPSVSQTTGWKRAIHQNPAVSESRRQMSNHYHLVVRCGAVLLARTMGFVQARFAQGYNQRNRLIGPLWQGRYKAKQVEDERHLQQVVLYVHINPVTAGVVDEPAGYPLSGHRELLRSQPGGLVDAEQTLSLFGGSVRTARQRYVRALEGARQAEWREELPGALPWWRREPDRPLSPPAPSSWVDERGVSSGLDRPQEPPHETPSTVMIGLAPAGSRRSCDGRPGECVVLTHLSA